MNTSESLPSVFGFKHSECRRETKYIKLQCHDEKFESAH